MSNKPHSEIRWGGGYDHYDENGKKVGSSVPNFHGGFDEYDASGNKIGESVANSKGGYTHYDKNYRKTGEVNPNFSGGFDHLDASGRKIGSSDLSFSGGYNNSSSDLRCVGTSMPEVYEFQANHQMPKPAFPCHKCHKPVFCGTCGTFLHIYHRLFYPPKKNIATDWPFGSVGGFFVVRVHSGANQPEAINFFRIFSSALLIVLRTVASLAI